MNKVSNILNVYGIATELKKHDKAFLYALEIELLWKPLNVITLGQRESDNIIRMITISESLSCIKHLTESDLGLGKSKSI